MQLLPNAVTTANFRRKVTFFFDDGTAESEFKTITQLTNRPRSGDIHPRILAEWQEHNPSIVRITFQDNPILLDANNPDEVIAFKIANLSA